MKNTTQHNKTPLKLELNSISLDKFIDLISVSETKETVLVPFNTLTGYSSVYVAEVKVGNEYDSEYKRCVTPLVASKDGLKNSLINQAKVHDKFNMNIQELMEDMTAESVVQYGVPDYLVDVGHRMWIATTPNDFRVFENKETGKKALACIAQGRLIINNVLKMTEQEARIVAKTYIETKKLE